MARGDFDLFNRAECLVALDRSYRPLRQEIGQPKCPPDGCSPALWYMMEDDPIAAQE